MDNNKTRLRAIIDRERTAITDTLIHQCPDDSRGAEAFFEVYDAASFLAQGSIDFGNTKHYQMIGRLARVGLLSIGEHDDRVNMEALPHD